jgi:hypothetical protein
VGQGGYLLEAGKVPVIDRDDGVIQLLGQCHWISRDSPVAYSVGEQS